jgi:hypothetical protein
MSKACEIGDCGISAVRRCAQCGKAFCLSHQAYDSHILSSNPANLCSACRIANEQQAHHTRQVATKQRSEARVLLPQIAALLREAGVPMRNYSRDLFETKVDHREVPVQGLFFKKKRIEEVKRSEIVGQEDSPLFFPAGVNSNSYESHESDCIVTVTSHHLQGITAEGAMVIVRCANFNDTWDSLHGKPSFTIIELDQVAEQGAYRAFQALVKLAKEHGIDLTGIAPWLNTAA